MTGDVEDKGMNRRRLLGTTAAAGVAGRGGASRARRGRRAPPPAPRRSARRSGRANSMSITYSSPPARAGRCASWACPRCAS